MATPAILAIAMPVLSRLFSSTSFCYRGAVHGTYNFKNVIIITITFV